MKKFKSIIVVLAILSANICATAQWNSSYYNNSMNFTTIASLNEDTVIAAEYGGLVVRTLNAGNDWQVTDPGFEITPNELIFPTTSAGYLLGNDGKVAKTTDCGETWELIVTDTSYDLTKSDFISSDKGWIIGNHISSLKGIVLKTEDGGSSWEYFYIDENIELFDIQMINESKGFIGIKNSFLNPYGFLKTDDGGTTWNLFNSNLERVSSISFIDANNGFCTSNSGLSRTYDGGETWIDITTQGIGMYTKNNLQFISDQVGFYAFWEVMTESGNILRQMMEEIPGQNNCIAMHGISI